MLSSVILMSFVYILSYKICVCRMC